MCIKEVKYERVFVEKPEQNDNNDFHLKFNIVMVYSAVKSIGKSIEFFLFFFIKFRVDRHVKMNHILINMNIWISHATD